MKIEIYTFYEKRIKYFITFILFLYSIAVYNKITLALDNNVTIYFFWGNGCHNCKEADNFLKLLSRKYPQLKIKYYEVWDNAENARLFSSMAHAYEIKVEAVPTIFIGNFEPFVGYLSDDTTGKSLDLAIKHCIDFGCIDPSEKAKNLANRKIIPQTNTSFSEQSIIKLPFLGEVELSKISLPVLTIIIAGIDGFNPCSFFVLLILLSVLGHAHSRKTMLFIGSIFIFFSGLIYFAFMSAWLNLFLILGQIKEITIFAGIIALLIALINIKEFFFLKKGVSLTIPDKAKPRIYELARKILRESSRPAMITGTIILAFTANIYELLCTAGFPMVYTRTLTLNNISKYSYYIYLVFYNLIYVIPLMFIVIIFSISVGKRKLSEWQGRILKLISGIMMFYLGLILIINPDILNNFLISLGLILVSLITSSVIILLSRRFSKI